MDHEARARALLALYDVEIAPLLAEHRIVSVDALDPMRAVLEQALRRSPALSVGFIGASQVGKSSIINALLGQRVVPAGGIGPLTAQATTIAYRDVNALEVKYHGGDQLNRLRLGLQSYLKKRGELSGHADAEEAPREVEVLLDADLARDETAPEDGDARGTSRVGEHMLSQVRLMLQRPGDTPELTARIRDLPRPVLLDAVRLMLAQPVPEVPAALDARLLERIQEVRRVLGRNESIFEGDDGTAEFRAHVRLRAAQWMSPLVARLQLHLRLPMLRDLSLVDLPGVGNVADPGAEIAREFVSQASAGALVVVFRNNGLTEDVIEILDRAGVFTRLLWGGRGGRPPIRIIVAVTYVDAVAQTRYDEIHDDTGETPNAEAIFRTCAADMTERIRDDLRRALEASRAYQETAGSLADRESAVKKALADAIDVIVVDAKDYLQIKEGQRRGRFLDDEVATNIPRLRQALLELVQGSVADRENAIHTAHRELHSSAAEALRALAGVYEQGGGRRSAEWERFRAELAGAAQPLAAELKAGRDAAGIALRDTVPAILDELCTAARSNALEKLRALRRRGEKLYWPSLNAAMKRGGTWEGKKLDYPGSLTRALVDTIAAAWEPTIVERVRAVVRDLAASEVQLVERICAEARRIDESLVADAQVDAQKRILRQQASSCVRWTNERLEELRDDVRAKLRDVVAGPIQAACEQSIARGKNRGPGASARILATFEKASAAAIEASVEKAHAVLRSHYQKLVSELEAGYLREHHDPVRAAVEALTGEELDRAREADQEAKRNVLRKAKRMAEKLDSAAPLELTP